MGQTIACTNQKGGVGKTTTVVNLATYLALLGDSVLVVDLDPQGNATSGLGIDRTSVAASMYDVLVDGASLDGLDVPTPVEGLRLVPSSIALAGADLELVGMDGRERRLARAISPIGHRWDWIFVDCPPSLGLLTVNALTGADRVLIPIQCEYYALEGLSQLIATINLVRDHLNPSLGIAGVILTMYDPRTNLSAEVAGEVRRHLRHAVFETIVPRSVRLSEAPSHGLPIALYGPGSKGAVAYAALAAELRSRARPGGPPATGREQPRSRIAAPAHRSAPDQRSTTRSRAAGPPVPAGPPVITSPPTTRPLPAAMPSVAGVPAAAMPSAAGVPAGGVPASVTPAGSMVPPPHGLPVRVGVTR